MITQPQHQHPSAVSTAKMKNGNCNAFSDAGGVFKNAASVHLLALPHLLPVLFLNQQSQSLNPVYSYMKLHLKIVLASITAQRGCVSPDHKANLFPMTMKTSLIHLLSIILRPRWPPCEAF